MVRTREIKEVCKDRQIYSGKNCIQRTICNLFEEVKKE